MEKMALKSKKERVDYIVQELDRLFPNPPIPLAHRDSYTLLVAVILSAHSTDARVNKATPILFNLAANPYDMAEVPVDKIEEIVRPCGLGKSKAKNISQMSKILIGKHGGVVPDNFKDLEELPGVGHKTASVIMCQVFNRPAFPVDTHIHRLAQRWELSSGKSVVQTERDLKKVFPQEKWNKLHLQIIYYARQYCQARVCDGTKCPLCKTLFPRRKRGKEYKRA